MPIIKSAIKKLKQSLVRRDRNRREKKALKEIVDSFRKAPSEAGLAKASSALDKAAKKNTIHRNKAARIKGRLAKLLKNGAKKADAKSLKKTSSQPKKKAVSKKA